MINRVLLRFVSAKKWIRCEAKSFLGARADQLHKNSKKHDEKGSTQKAHGRTAKYWTVPNSHFQPRSRPRDRRSVMSYYEITGLPLYCIKISVQTSMANLAIAYMHQGRCEAAEGLRMGVVEISKKKFWADHPDMLSMRNLAFTWKEQGRDENA